VVAAFLVSSARVIFFQRSPLKIFRVRLTERDEEEAKVGKFKDMTGVTEIAVQAAPSRTDDDREEPPVRDMILDLSRTVKLKREVWTVLQIRARDKPCRIPKTVRYANWSVTKQAERRPFWKELEAWGTTNPHGAEAIRETWRELCCSKNAVPDGSRSIGPIRGTSESGRGNGLRQLQTEEERVRKAIGEASNVMDGQDYIFMTDLNQIPIGRVILLPLGGDRDMKNAYDIRELAKFLLVPLAKKLLPKFCKWIQPTGDASVPRVRWLRLFYGREDECFDNDEVCGPMREPLSWRQIHKIIRHGLPSTFSWKAYFAYSAFVRGGYFGGGEFVGNNICNIRSDEVSVATAFPASCPAHATYLQWRFYVIRAREIIETYKTSQTSLQGLRAQLDLCESMTTLVRAETRSRTREQQAQRAQRSSPPFIIRIGRPVTFPLDRRPSPPPQTPATSPVTPAMPEPTSSSFSEEEGEPEAETEETTEEDSSSDDDDDANDGFFRETVRQSYVRTQHERSSNDSNDSNDNLRIMGMRITETSLLLRETINLLQRSLANKHAEYDLCVSKIVHFHRETEDASSAWLIQSATHKEEAGEPHVHNTINLRLI